MRRGVGGAPAPPHFLARGGKGGAHHFELHPLVCIVCSGKVITLTQQCITQVTKVMYKQPAGPLILGLVRPSLKNCQPSCSLHLHYAPPPPPTFKVAPKPLM